MSAQIIPFAFEDSLVRTVQRDGEPWFVGKDVCKVLDIRDHNQALERLDDDERGGCSVPTPRGLQEVIVVSEAGVFRLIFTSRKPEAERFKRWLAHEVLPALRKTGSYAVPGREPIQPGAEPVRIEELKLAKVREARLLYGHARARLLWEELGLDHVPAVTAGPDADARRCLDMVLDAEIDGNGRPLSVRTAILAALDDDESMAARLASEGVRIDAEHDGFIVANDMMLWAEVFRGTEFASGRHSRALKRLPGARPWHAQRYGQATSRGTWLPARLLD